MKNTALKNWMDNFSSIEKVITHRHGETIIWKDRVIKDKSGNPVSLEMYLRLTGERRMVRKDMVQPQTPAEKQAIKACKSDYKKGMRNIFGKNWRVLSRKHRIFNVPSDENLIKSLRNLS